MKVSWWDKDSIVDREGVGGFIVIPDLRSSRREDLVVIAATGAGESMAGL
jgi:hypothetical protein